MMSQLVLIIGNKNYSSWSLRAWMALTHLGLDFREVQVRLSTPAFKSEIARHTGHGRVPVLKHGELTVWDSLAICEYAAELAGRGWPVDASARAAARSICAEMHSGFQELRARWPVNARARKRRTTMTDALRSDIARIDAIWCDCRDRYGERGAWLFGEYSIADAMYAPVVLRFNTYGASLSATARAYVEAALADPALQRWIRDAEREPWVIEEDEAGEEEKPQA
jgi:glutathione S-transferase